MDWKAEYTRLLDDEHRDAVDLADLERLGIAAYLSGNEAASIDVHTRAHQLAVDRGDVRQAARSAFWIVFALLGSRDLARAAGWGARAKRLLDGAGLDCVERGYLFLPQALECISAGNLAGAADAFEHAQQVGRRFHDVNLTCLAMQGHGRMLVSQGRESEGIVLLDEAMTAVSAGEVSTIIAGVVYCSVISTCFDMLDLRRAREWTDALHDWCEAQTGMVSYRGECLAHRAELLALQGRWNDAVDEARRAWDALAAAKGWGQGIAAYALGELHRLRGDYAAAEEAFRLASEHGRTPYPGLALLRLEQGHAAAAHAAIDRVMAEHASGRQLAAILAAAVDIRLACDDVAGASEAASALRSLTEKSASTWLKAIADAGTGAVLLAEGRARESLGPLRKALAGWRELGAPYEAARVGVLIGRACRLLGDADGADLEWDTAARLFRECAAAPALAGLERVRNQAPGTVPAEHHVLTGRELEVLQLIAQGKSNRAIATALDISEKTVARHTANIFTKLDVSSRTAATAYAFTHGLTSSRPT